MALYNGFMPYCLRFMPQSECIRFSSRGITPPPMVHGLMTAGVVAILC